jgi:hypothetical protein
MHLFVIGSRREDFTILLEEFTALSLLAQRLEVDKLNREKPKTE